MFDVNWKPIQEDPTENADTLLCMCDIHHENVPAPFFTSCGLFFYLNKILHHSGVSVPLFCLVQILSSVTSGFSPKLKPILKSLLQTVGKIKGNVMSWIQDGKYERSLHTDLKNGNVIGLWVWGPNMNTFKVTKAPLSEVDYFLVIIKCLDRPYKLKQIIDNCPQKMSLMLAKFYWYFCFISNCFSI